MPATERRRHELEHHDAQARGRAEFFALHPEALHFRDADYLDHETWIRPAFAELGDVAGRAVLDYGCGHGMASAVLARRGARVTAFDLSPFYLDEAHRRARANGVAIDFVQADAEHLPFADASFACVWGNAILHHLDLAAAGRELARVLRPGGVAVFCEPWGENPLLGWARRRLPYPGKARTRDEEPLRQADVEVLREVFPDLRVRGFQLLAMVRRVLPLRPLVGVLERCDRWLFDHLPAAERYCRYVVLTLRR
jgi:SAM-dependent methyltransferase